MVNESLYEYQQILNKLNKLTKEQLEDLDFRVNAKLFEINAEEIQKVSIDTSEVADWSIP